MGEYFAYSDYFGLLLCLGSFLAARWINGRMGREVCNPLLFATLACGAVLVGTGTEYGTFYESGADKLEFLLTPATICLAIPLYRQFALLRKNGAAVLAGCAAGVAAHMAGCALMLVLYKMDGAAYITLLPKSITTAIGTSSHAAGTSRAVELGDVQGAASSLAIVVTGLLTVVAAPVMAGLAG